MAVASVTYESKIFSKQCEGKPEREAKALCQAALDAYGPPYARICTKFWKSTRKMDVWAEVSPFGFRFRFRISECQLGMCLPHDGAVLPCVLGHSRDLLFPLILALTELHYAQGADDQTPVSRRLQQNDRQDSLSRKYQETVDKLAEV